MAFDLEKFNGPATRAEVARASLQASIVASATQEAIRLLAKKVDVDVVEILKTIDDAARRLDEYFDTLTGYTPDA